MLRKHLRHDFLSFISYLIPYICVFYDNNALHMSENVLLSQCFASGIFTMLFAMVRRHYDPQERI